MIFRFVLTLSCALGLMGCDQKVEQAPASPVVEGGTGTVRGKVKLLVAPPVMKEIANQPCHSGAGSIKEETVITGADGALKNVVVYVKGLASGDARLAQPALLDQKNCQYVPHVLAVRVNQPVIFRSSDPTMHNVHYTPDKNPAANLSMTKAGDEERKEFAQHDFIRVRCDVHPWMNAYVAVLENPWFAVTDETGAFELTGLPNRELTIGIWHELYGQREQKVDLSKSQELTIGFEVR